MKYKRLTTLIMVGWVTLGFTSVSASVITPTGVWASSIFDIYDVNNLIDDSGLSDKLYHDTNEGHMWLSKEKDIKSTLTFNLGAVYNLSGAYIWQYNPSAGGTASGVQNFNISTSLDNVVFNAITTASLTQAVGINSIEAQFRSFNRTAKFVKFSVLSNFGDNYTGLSEVKFQEGPVMPDIGSLVPPSNSGIPIPEPSLTSLLGLSLLGLFMLRGMSRFYNA
jgi:hypothetical protein